MTHNIAIYHYTHEHDERPLAVSIIQRLLQWKKSHFIQSEIYKQFSVSNLRLPLWIIAVGLPAQQPNSCIFQPCDLLPTFPLLHIPALHFWPYRISHSRIFSLQTVLKFCCWVVLLSNNWRFTNQITHCKPQCWETCALHHTPGSETAVSDRPRSWSWSCSFGLGLSLGLILLVLLPTAVPDKALC